MIATIWKWVKRIALVLIAIGGAILAFVFIRGKGHSIEKPEGIGSAEDKIKEDQARIVEKDKEIAAKEDEIQKIADDTKEKLKENESKPDQPGDAGKAGDDFNKTW